MTGRERGQWLWWPLPQMFIPAWAPVEVQALPLRGRQAKRCSLPLCSRKPCNLNISRAPGSWLWQEMVVSGDWGGTLWQLCGEARAQQESTQPGAQVKHFPETSRRTWAWGTGSGNSELLMGTLCVHRRVVGPLSTCPPPSLLRIVLSWSQKAGILLVCAGIWKQALRSFFFFKIVFIFRERKGGRKRGWETSMCGCLLCATRGLACNAGMCPDWESHKWPFGSQDVTQFSEPHQPGPKGLFK